MTANSCTHATDPSFSRVLDMGRNLTNEALKMGLSAIRPIRLRVLGMVSSINSGTENPNRDAIVSFSQPTPSQYDVELWVNPSNKRIFKSIPSEQVWKLVLSRRDLFVEDNPVSQGTSTQADSIGQPVANIPELLGINTTNVPDKAIYYVESEKSIYAFDKESTDPVSAPMILRPNTGPGRWFQITNVSGTIGNIDGGTF